MGKVRSHVDLKESQYVCFTVRSGRFISYQGVMVGSLFTTSTGTTPDSYHHHLSIVDTSPLWCLSP